MKIQNHILAFLILLSGFCSGISALASDRDTGTRIFDPRFRTLKTSLVDLFMSPPVIRLGSDDRILVSFDEIGEDRSYLQCRLVHCNSDWQPSSLTDAEFIDGFNFAEIEDIGYSSNTFVHYINYHIEIPNDHLQIIRSGNYLLEVFDPDDPDTVLLQTRFRVTENAAPVSGTATSRTDRGHNTEWQQLDFAVSIDGLDISNPYTDLWVELRQNDTENSTRILRSPSRLDGSRLVYSHIPALIYPASNEYRRFESVSNTFPGMNVDSVRWGGSNYHIFLRPDRPKADRPYEYDRTQHGRFIVREYNATDSEVGADYITVHFLLLSPRLDKDVYVDGEFTGGRLSDHNRMKYDPEAGCYRAEIPLKQGAYNYRYVTMDSRSGLPDPSDIEGNFYETENEYSVAVYLRRPGERADRLLNHAIIVSN